MPWDVGVEQQQSWERRADYRSEKQCQRSSYAFYCAVRDLLPVWALEDMRTMEVFHWEDDGRACSFTPSEALLYALVHDHQQYARYLLNRYSVRALEMPSRSFCCCQTHAAPPHLSVAVRYNRTSILRMMMAQVKDFSTEAERRLYLDSRGGCVHDADAGKTPVHLACDLARPECLLLLLGHGACPCLADRTGLNPLDCLLHHMCHAPANMAGGDAHRMRECLGYLLLFMPKPSFQLKDELLKSPQLWQRLVGEEAFNWLTGLTPPSLFVQAMRSLTQSIPAEQMDTLPDFLKPLDFRLQQA